MDTQFIVTEYGVCDLRGKSTTERALGLIELAHPEFRDELLVQAKSWGTSAKWIGNSKALFALPPSCTPRWLAAPGRLSAVCVAAAVARRVHSIPSSASIPSSTETWQRGMSGRMSVRSTVAFR